MKNKIKMLGVDISTESKKEILEHIKKELSKPKKVRGKIIIFTPNPEQLSHAAEDSGFRSKLNEADIALPDGVGVIIAARILGLPIKARIPGVEFMESLVKEASELQGGSSGSAKRPVNIGFFGGQPQVAEETAECLAKKYLRGEAIGRKVRIGYASHVFDKEKMIQSDIDILFVALGSPRQEEWILTHKNEVPASIIMAVGGSFDFISGKIPRAPKFLRLLGLEWLFRLIIQPWRIFRQLRLLHFSALILAEALGSRVKRLKIAD